MWGIVLWSLLAVILILGIFGIRIVQQQERWIVERFGRYHRTLRPGLNWIFPWIMRVRAVIFVWEQAVPLFEEDIKIDLKDGSVQPKEVEVFVRILDPDKPYSVGSDEPRNGTYRAVYEVDDWGERIKDLIENAVRTYLNRLTIDEAITTAKPGYDLVSLEKEEGLPNHELEKIRNILKGWGFELLRITVQDFVLEPELVEARGRVQIRQREAEAAKYVAQRRAEETIGAVIAMLAISRGKDEKDIRKEIDKDESRRREFLALATDLITRRMAIDGDSFVDIRVDGAEGMEKALLGLLAALRMIPPKGERHEETS